MNLWKDYLEGRMGPAEFVTDVFIRHKLGSVVDIVYRPRKELVFVGNKGELNIPLNGEDPKKAETIANLAQLIKKQYL